MDKESCGKSKLKLKNFKQSIINRRVSLTQNYGFDWDCLKYLPCRAQVFSLRTLQFWATLTKLYQIDEPNILSESRWLISAQNRRDSAIDRQQSDQGAEIRHLVSSTSIEHSNWFICFSPPLSRRSPPLTRRSHRNQRDRNHDRGARNIQESGGQVSFVWNGLWKNQP